MFRVGLTGGIACGKTTAALRFARLGVAVADADQVARELVEPGQPALQAIVDRFGERVLSGGRLDRAELRRCIFASPEARHWLEQLLHPPIYRELARRAEAATSPYCLLVIPLILETGRRDSVDRLLVVDCPPELQRERLRARDGLDDTAIDTVLSTQCSRERRLAAADDVIVNDGVLETLHAGIDHLHRRYLALAAGPNATEQPRVRSA